MLNQDLPLDEAFRVVFYRLGMDVLYAIFYILPSCPRRLLLLFFLEEKHIAHIFPRKFKSGVRLVFELIVIQQDVFL